MRILAARWSPQRETPKAQLMRACEETGVQPRPNWRNPSVQEMLREVEKAANSCGLVLLGPARGEDHFGSRSDYQTIARWGFHSRELKLSTTVQYDVRTGKFRGAGGAQMHLFREALKTAAVRAREGARINRVDARDEMALALMGHCGIAPFCTIPSQGRGRWMIAADTLEFKAARRFLAKVDCKAVHLSELEPNEKALRATILDSLSTSRTRFGSRTGWVEIAQRSHLALLREAGLE